MGPQGTKKCKKNDLRKDLFRRCILKHRKHTDVPAAGNLLRAPRDVDGKLLD